MADKMTVPGAGPNYDEIAKTINTQAPAVPDYTAAAKSLDRDAASVNLKAVSEVNPDKAAEAQKLAKITGLPTPAVEGNEDQVAAQVRYDDNVRRLTTAPATASFLSNPDNAKIAHDSVEKLAASEAAWKGLAKDTAAIGISRDQIAGAVDAPGSVMRGIGELYGVAERQVGARVSKGVQAGLRAIGMTDFADALAAPVPWWVDPSQVLKKPGEAIGAVAEDIRTPKAERNLITDVHEGVGQVGAQIAVALATVGASSYISLATMAGQGADQQAQQIKEAGAEQGDNTDVALLAGSAITMLMERYGLGNLLDKIPAAIKTKMGRMLAGFGSEASQEIAEQVLGNLTALALYDPTQDLFEGVQQSGEVGGIVGMIVSAVIPGRHAKVNQNRADAAVKEIAGSPLAERDPAAAAQVFAQQMEGVGFKEVHIPAVELAKVIEASDDPVATAKAMGVEGQMAEALALGGEVRLSAQQFAEHIALTDNYEAVKDFVRYGDADMSVKDAEEFATTGVKDEARAMAAAVSRDAENVTTSDPSAEPDPVTLAEEQLGLQGLFRSAAEAGMTPKQYESYLAAVAQSKDDARKRQERKVLRQQERENSAAFKEARANIESEVKETVAQLPVYAALNSIGRERLDRNALLTLLPDYMVYDKETGVNKVRTSKEQLADLPKVNGRQIYESSSKGGINPDILAEQHGFKSAQDMIENFILAPSFEQQVQTQTDLVMKERHGDILDRATALREAIESLHNDTQAALLAAELNQLRDAKKQGRITPALLRAEARRLLAEHLVRDIRADRFMVNERKAGTEAGKLLRKGDRAGAAAAKFRQLLNFQYVREAYAVRANFTKQSKELRKFMRQRKEWRNIEASYVDTIRERLAGYDLVKALDPEGNDMTWGAWQELYEGVKHLEAQGRAAKKYRLRERNVEFDWLVAEMTDQASTLETTERQERLQKQQTPGFVDRSLAGLSAWNATIAKVELMLQKLDGGVLGGIWHKAIFQRAATAQAAQLDMMAKTIKPVITALNNLPKETRQRFSQKVQTQLRDQPMRRSELLMLALNVGNESNFTKLIEGSQKENANWTEAQVMDALSHLTKEEWQWVQSVWDTFETLYPQIEAIYRDERGTSPEKIVPRAFETADGYKVKGGYFPMMYDPARRPAQENRTALEMMEAETRGSVYSGMTKARTGYAAPVLLDLGQLPRGLEQAVHFITHYDTIRDLRRLINEKSVAAAVRDKLGPEAHNEMKRWMEDIAANGRDPDPMPGWDGMFQYFRASLTTAVMGLSYTTGVSQAFGLSTSVAALGQKPGGGFSSKEGVKWLTIGLSRYAANPAAAWKEVRELSGEMRHRLENTNREVSQAIKKLREPNNIPGLRQYQDMQRASLMMIGGIQFAAVDVPTWMGAYAKAQSEGMEQDDAVAYADGIVRTSQASGHTKDLSRIQRKSGLMRAATMFASYTILLYNLQGQTFGNMGKVKNLPGAVARMGWLVLIPAILDMIMRSDLPDDDEENPEIWYAKRLLGYSLSSIPFVGRPMDSLLRGYDPALLAIESLGKNAARAFKVLSKIVDPDEEVEGKDIAAVTTFLGSIAGMPGTMQLGRVLSAIEAEDDADFYDFLVGHKDK